LRNLARNAFESLREQSLFTEEPTELFGTVVAGDGSRQGAKTKSFAAGEN
jgi:hypothetical protein